MTTRQRFEHTREALAHLRNARALLIDAAPVACQVTEGAIQSAEEHERELCALEISEAQKAKPSRVLFVHYGTGSVFWQHGEELLAAPIHAGDVIRLDCIEDEAAAVDLSCLSDDDAAGARAAVAYFVREEQYRAAVFALRDLTRHYAAESGELPSIANIAEYDENGRLAREAARDALRTLCALGNEWNGHKLKP